MRKAILTNAIIKDLVVYPFKYGLLNCSGKTLPLPPDYAKVAQCSGVASGELMALYGERVLSGVL